MLSEWQSELYPVQHFIISKIGSKLERLFKIFFMINETRNTAPNLARHNMDCHVKLGEQV